MNGKHRQFREYIRLAALHVLQVPAFHRGHGVVGAAAEARSKTGARLDPYRGQNEEADVLKEFGGFDMRMRIERDFGDLKFEILDGLMVKAGELHAEIKLAKSSKEAKGDRPVDKNKRKRGETKWKNPWYKAEGDVSSII